MTAASGDPAATPGAGPGPAGAPEAPLAASPPAAAPGAPAPSAGWTPPPPTRPSRTGTWVLIAAIVVAAIVVLGTLYAVGVFTPASHATGPMTFHTAAGEVNAYLAGYHGGGWKLVGAAGVAPPSARSFLFNETPLPAPVSSCLTAWLVANHTSVALTPYTGSPSTGQATIWTFLAANSTTLLVVVNNAGSVQPFFSATCAASLALLPGLPANVIDSSTAAQAAWNAGESGFVAQHPGGESAYAVLPALSLLGSSAGGSYWQLVYAACDPATTAAATIVPVFNATVNSVSGVVVAHNSSTMPCGTLTNLTLPLRLGLSPPFPPLPVPPPPVPVGVGVAFHPAVEARSAGTYYYNFSVQSSAAGLTWSDLHLVVRTASGGTAPLPSGSTSWTVVGASGRPLAGTNDSASLTGWVFGGSTGVSTTQFLSLSTSVDLYGAGDQLLAQGTGTYAGNVSTSIP